MEMDSKNYEQLYPHLLPFANKIARDSHEANDLIQEAWLRSMKHSYIFELELPKQRAWFFKTMKRMLIDERRKHSRVQNEWAVFDGHPAEELFSDFSKVEVSLMMTALPEDLYDLVYKTYWLGMSSLEIARLQGMPASTIRSKIKKALVLLQKTM